jgi:ankyrin repeat protein
MRKSAILLSAALLLAASPSDEPLFEAVGSGDVDKVRALLQEGADVNAAPGDGMTALHRTARTGDLAMVELLIGAGADLEAGSSARHRSTWRALREDPESSPSWSRPEPT